MIRPASMLIALAAITFVISFQWTNAHLPEYLEQNPKSDATVSETLGSALGLEDPARGISAPSLFLHNLRATAVIALIGVLSFGILGVLSVLLNIGLIGVVLSAAGFSGYQPAVLFFAGVFPHGLFELPALLLSAAAILRMGLVLVTPQAERTIGEVFIESLAEWLRIFMGLVIPLLAIAALVETYITPRILCRVAGLACAILR